MSEKKPADLSTPHQSNLYTALAKAQAEFPEAVLDKKNPRFGNRYASLPSILRAVIPSLTKHELALTHGYDHERNVFRSTLHHAPSHETYSSDCPVFKFNDIQAYGSQQTYAMRYNIVALCSLIADEEENVKTTDDDGNAASDGSKNTPPSSPPQSPPVTNKPPAVTPPKGNPKKQTVSEIINKKHGNTFQKALEADRERMSAPTPPEDFDQGYPPDWDEGSFDQHPPEPVPLIQQLKNVVKEKGLTNEEVGDLILKCTGRKVKSTALSTEELEMVVLWITRMIDKKR